MSKQFKIPASEIKRLISPIGGCMASDKITVLGEKVAFMCRETPEFTNDSGWRFMSGTETEDYANDPNNWNIYDVNTIVNYDGAIIKYLSLPIGTDLIRLDGKEEFVDAG